MSGWITVIYIIASYVLAEALPTGYATRSGRFLGCCKAVGARQTHRRCWASRGHLENGGCPVRQGL